MLAPEDLPVPTAAAWTGPSAGRRAWNFGEFPLEAAADVALVTVHDHLRGETGIERVTFVLRPSAVETFRRRLAAV